MFEKKKEEEEFVSEEEEEDEDTIYKTPIRNNYFDETQILKTKSPMIIKTPKEFEEESKRATRKSLNGLKKHITEKPENINKTYHFQNMIQERSKKINELKDDTEEDMEENKFNLKDIIIILILISILIFLIFDFKLIFNIKNNDFKELIKNKESEQVLNLILNKKINKNEIYKFDNKENVPLFFGVKYCDLNFIKKLIKLNVNLEYRNFNYNNLLHQVRCLKIVKYLFGDSSNSGDDDGGDSINNTNNTINTTTTTTEELSNENKKIIKNLLYFTNKQFNNPLIHLLKLYYKRICIITGSIEEEKEKEIKNIIFYFIKELEKEEEKGKNKLKKN